MSEQRGYREELITPWATLQQAIYKGNHAAIRGSRTLLHLMVCGDLTILDYSVHSPINRFLRAGVERAEPNPIIEINR
ncbi:hypothetical protein PGT21_008196 [Puccinia graminis f. sp. tritici]|uniref:Uncharacterized protein n=1 Tax=Puccinia graminis f. sp. tritici TaxID=56615 RepID=A0A5B0NF50_PUCGR|nr:hypothetical protein PGT21_008196 [Puccinia graminis f. sp. tritici]